MAIKIGGTTIVNDSRGVTNITSGVVVGVKSDGTYLGAGATTLIIKLRKSAGYDNLV